MFPLFSLVAIKKRRRDCKTIILCTLTSGLDRPSETHIKCAMAKRQSRVLPARLRLDRQAPGGM